MTAEQTTKGQFLEPYYGF